MPAETPEDLQPITKIMSISRREFHRSILRLHRPAGDLELRSHYEVPSGAGRVSIRIEPLAPQIHGGLLSLPRARVTFRFDGLTKAERDNFLARFDLTFRRGGG